MIDYGAARAHLADVLEPVWPGRVRPYRPTRPSPTAGIYIGTHDGGWGDVTSWRLTFAVRVVADGADRAADALLDDLLSQIYRAVAASDDCYPNATTWDPLLVDDVVELPAYTFTVDVAVADVTWCADDPPAAVTVPPVPIGA